MADSPSKYKDRILAWTIYCDGKALDEEGMLRSRQPQESGRGAGF